MKMLKSAALMPALLLVLMSAVCVNGAGAQQSPRDEERTNVILILADDLGYGDLSGYGSKICETPNIDRLAREGVRFTQFNTPAPYCAPTRSSLMTGRYQFRTGMTGNPLPRADPAGTDRSDRMGMNLDEVTVADVFRKNGYSTCAIGKWHLGHQPQFRPLRRGFDEYLGILYSNDMHRVELIDGDRVVEYPVVQATLTRRYTDRAISFIERNKEKPFFLYLPHAMPHKPLAASEEYYRKSGKGLYADVMRELDAEIGRLLKRVSDLGLERRTMVVFTSDNGPWYGGSAGGLRGMKSQTWEGGLRVPLIARWPGRIPPGRTIKTPGVTPDLFPTVLSAAKLNPPAGRKLDGVDLLPTMEGRATGEADRPIFSLLGDRLCSVRSGRWKLHVVPARGGRDRVPAPDAPYTDPRGPDGVRILAPYEQAHPSQHPGVVTGDSPGGPALFDLSADPSEQKDVIEDHPQVARRLRVLYDEMNEQVRQAVGR